MIRNAAVLLSGLTIISCVDNYTVEDNPSGEPSVELNEHNNIVEDTYFSDYADMNTFAGDDFYQYAVGKWLTEHPLKAEESQNGTYPELMALCEK